VGLGKRFWEVARANASDFASAFSLDSEVRERRRVDSEIEAEVAREVAETVGARAGRKARSVADKAEQAWERAFEEARARGDHSPAGKPSQAQIEAWHRTLEVEVGADFASIRKSYRRLLAKYHPDKYAGDSDKYAAATEVARKITIAYNGLKSLDEG
jgi:DnaJ-domain-containing protein 1